MLSLKPIPPCPLMPTSDAANRQEHRTQTTPENFLASLVAHIRDKNLSDAQCVSAIRTAIGQLAAG